jgi:Secretion system C-terminal sorting domain
MKQLLLFGLLFIAITTQAQNKLLFEYDKAGNQVKRELCINCNPLLGKAVKEIAEIQTEDLVKFTPQDVLSYYPNPVKEELYLQWELSESNSVSTIEVYTLSGQLLKSYTALENKKSQNIPFSSLPQGIYNLRLIYSNTEVKAIKIIKE